MLVGISILVRELPEALDAVYDNWYPDPDETIEPDRAERLFAALGVPKDERGDCTFAVGYSEHGNRWALLWGMAPGDLYAYEVLS